MIYYFNNYMLILKFNFGEFWFFWRKSFQKNGWICLWKMVSDLV